MKRTPDGLGIETDNRPVVAGPPGSALATLDAVIAVLQAVFAALWLLIRIAVRITLHIAVFVVGFIGGLSLFLRR